MSRRIKMPRSLPRQRIKYFLLKSIFTLAFAVSVILGSSSPSYVQTQNITREKVIIEIKDYAERHVQNNKSMDTRLIVDLFKDEGVKVKLTKKDLARIYEKEYNRLNQQKKNNDQNNPKPSLFQKLPSILLNPKRVDFGIIGWGTAVVLLILLIFRDVITDCLSNSIKTAGNWLYNRIAGTQFLRSRPLRRYKKSLVESYQKLNITFRPNKPLNMRETYVPLKITETSDSDQIEAYQAIKEYPRLMVKGQPGSGKSMLLKHIVLTYGEGRLMDLPKHPVPILLKLDQLNSLTDSDIDQEEKLKQELIAVLNRTLIFLHDFSKAEGFVNRGLKEGTLMLLFDGLDEVKSERRSKVVKAIKNLLLKYRGCRAIITCRTVVYKNEFAEEVDQTLEIVNFSDQQIRRFLQSWESEMPSEKSIDQLMQKLLNRPRIMALARNPLLLTIIAYLYSDTSFELPHSRAEFYQESTDVLLSNRDQERQIDNKYEVNDKSRILQCLAICNQDNVNQQQQDCLSIDRQTVLYQINQILPSLDLKQNTDTKPILKEIVERSGLLLELDSGERYEFSHLTFQEFFAAKALKDKNDDLVKYVKEDPDGWRETVKFWCGLPGDKTSLIREFYEQKVREPDAIIIALEFLAYAEQVDSDLEKKIIEESETELGKTENENLVIGSFASLAAEENKPRGEQTFLLLKNILLHNEKSDDRKRAAAKALSKTNLSKAAKVLAQNYHQQELREPLRRMGDLAVPELESLAEEYPTALDDLLTIGTPKAITALVSFLWNSDEELENKAAWNLAKILPQAKVEETLRGYKLKEKQRAADYFNWIWKPFEKYPDSALSIIAGRIAYLIDKVPTERIPRDVPTLDPRLVIPLCSIQAIDQVRLPPNLSNLAYALLGRSEESEDLNEQFLEQVNQIVNVNNSSERWRSLLSSLPSRLQLDLLRRLINLSKPKQSDWETLFREVKYEFKNSWYYYLVLILALAISIVAVVGIIKITSFNNKYWLYSLLGLSFFVVSAFWIFLWKGIKEKLEPNTFFRFGLCGPATFLIELSRLFKKQIVWAGVESLLKILVYSWNGALIGTVVGALIGILIRAWVGDWAWAWAGAWVGALVGAGAWAWAGTWVGALVGAGTWVGALVLAGAWTWALTGIWAGALTGAWVGAGAGALGFCIETGAGGWAGALTGALTGALVLTWARGWAWAGAWAGAFYIGLGIGAWFRAKNRNDFLKFLAIFAFPFFCWSPIVGSFATYALLQILSWQYTIGVWLILIGLSTILWLYGQKREQKPRNPLQGILSATRIAVGPYFELNAIRVQVKNPKGPVSIQVKFDHVKSPGTENLLIPITLRDGHTTLKRGWRNMFTNTEKYIVEQGSEFKVDMREYGPFGEWKRNVIEFKPLEENSNEINSQQKIKTVDNVRIKILFDDI